MFVYLFNDTDGDLILSGVQLRNG